VGERDGREVDDGRWRRQRQARTGDRQSITISDDGGSSLDIETVMCLVRHFSSSNRADS